MSIPSEAPEIDAALVRSLIASQFPEWSALEVRPVEHTGWDNRTFRLGEQMAVRLPSGQGYVAQVNKEQRWLPRLAPHLPLHIPTPLEIGTPGRGYPWPWSVYRWIDGQDAQAAPIDDKRRLATELAEFLKALHRIDPADGPEPGSHNCFRGGPVSTYEAETRDAITALSDRIDSPAATAIWASALDSTWRGPPVWVHGDLSASNLLVRDNMLAAVIDFGCLAVGDPACDLVIAWTHFSGESREVFQAAIALDEATWARARGWALWKALITLAGTDGTNPEHTATSSRVLNDLLTHGA